MKFFLETNPAFLILKINEEQYVFYNSLQHIGARLDKLEILILDLYYKYNNIKYIVKQFPENKSKIIYDALCSIDKLKLLRCKDLKDETYKDAVLPSIYYFHLTYHCNLKCTYCYNKNIRKKQKKILTLDKWKSIVDKISKYAKSITLTGGEFFLYPYVVDLVKYIKDSYPHINISAISNCNHNFKECNISAVFNYLSSISFSCDSISRVGERKGFDPLLFKSNILWLKERFPKLEITIASTYTNNNAEDLKEISLFCKNNECSLDKTIIIPENIDEIDLMPDYEQQIREGLAFSSNDEIKQLKRARLRCSAGKEICSIDPIGRVFPCQSLHHEDFCLGNLCKENLEDLKYIGKKGFCLKTVNNLPVCSKCKVKYICGGGCLATGYKLYGNKVTRNHLTCHLNYINSINKLKSLNNRI